MSPEPSRTPQPAQRADVGPRVRVREHRRVLLRCWLVNLALATLVGLSYLGRLAEDAPPRVLLFSFLGLVSSLATLSILPLSLLWASARLRWFVALQATVWMLFQMGLYIDTRIHRLFGYHFNGSALNLFVTRGSEDSFRLGAGVLVPGFALGGALVVLQLVTWRVCRSRAALPGVPSGRLRARAVAVALLLASVIGVEKTLYAHAEVTLDRQLTAASQVLPLYPRLSVKPFLSEALRASMPALPVVRLSDEPRPLAYPLERPRVDPLGPRPDVVVLVIDSWRADALREDATPEMARLARVSRRFEDHLSGGNGTRFGVFAMLYGLHGSYWWSVLAERRPPVLVETLVELGYELRVFSSASMDFPEFSSTAWVGLSEGVHDDFGEAPASVRDERAAEACIAWWRGRERGADGRPRRPAFTFVLLDSSHQAYDFPADDAPFRPYAERLDYLELSRSTAPELVTRVENRYLNGVHHADRVAGRLVAELEASGALEHTVLVVTGDHGEEFAENGFWGHTGNFTPEQVAVPLLLCGPGIEPGRETRPTSHLDLAPTLLELLGADPAQRGRWCLGGNLLDPDDDPRRTVAAWSEVGLVTEVGIVRVPRSPDEQDAVSVWTSDWKLVEDQRAAFERLGGALERLDEQCNRFLREATRPAAADPR